MIFVPGPDLRPEPNRSRVITFSGWYLVEYNGVTYLEPEDTRLASSPSNSGPTDKHITGFVLMNAADVFAATGGDVLVPNA